MTPSVTRLVQEIERLHAAAADSAGAEAQIEEYLHRELRSLDREEQERILAALQRAFAPAPGAGAEEAIARFCSLLLGREVSAAELSSEDRAERLVEALDTVFRNLDELVLAMNTTMVEAGEDGETIRHIAGRRMEDDRSGISLEEYLERIRAAFLVSHQAFRFAAREMVAKILRELDPEQPESRGDSGFRFGMMKKAGSRERWTQAFNNVKTWYDSGRCMEEFRREFEKQCLRLSREGR